MNWLRTIVDRVSERLGGRLQARVILLLGMTLGLSGADLGAVGSMSSILQHHFSITKAQIGILVAASQGTGVFSTLFFGWWVDRAKRTRLLAITVALWGLAMIACGAATSYRFLLVARVGLGAVAAATLPCTASLVGDFFPGRERGKIYGYILGGEMIGTGFGFILSGETASLWWRLGFWVLLLPALPLAWWLYKLPEPERGGQSLGEEGRQENAVPDEKATAEAGSGERLIARKAREAGVQPRTRLVKREDPARQPLWWAVLYVVSIPTNLVLIIGSALGFAFFADARTFGVEYAQARFHWSHSAAVWLLITLGIGALAGVWVGGRLGDRLLAKGHLPARLWVATGFFWASTGCFLAALLVGPIWLAILCLACSAFSLGAVNPPLDSARLDIMHPRLWGRAESVRTILRDGCEAVAPVTFGWLVADFGGGAAGLSKGFLLMLIPLAIAAALGFIGFRTYPPDAAAASEYTRKTMHRTGQEHE